MRPVYLLLLLLLGLTALACGSWPTSETESPSPTPRPCTGYQGPPGTALGDRDYWAPPDSEYAGIAPRTPNPALEELLDLELEFTFNPVPCTATTRFTMRVTNTSGAPQLLDRPTWYRDYVVMDEEGRQVWRWIAGTVYSQPSTPGAIHLAPGESEEFPVLWQTTHNDGSPAEPGVYTVQGFFRADTESEPCDDDCPWIATEKRELVVSTPPPREEPEE
ncbi:MAG: BsuPI-related putative proteinase inhibitor [Chloroflexota bacterium]